MRLKHPNIVRTFQTGVADKINYLVMTVPDDMLRKVMTAYKIQGIPKVVLIDRKGIVRGVVEGGGDAAAQRIDSQVRKLLSNKS